MTVAKLIARLRELPPDAPVYRDDCEWGPLAVTGVETCTPKPCFFNGEPRPPGFVIE